MPAFTYFRPTTAVRWRYLLGALALSIGQLAAQESELNAAPPPASEREIKAAMLYRIAKFIDWPAQSFANKDAPFVICVAGDRSVLHAFHALNGRVLNDHSIAVRRVSGDAFDLRQCHAAFFPRDSFTDTDYALNKLQGMPVLTIGEAENFAERGGMVALITRDARVEFAFNLSASKQAQLQVSAQLLQLATVVRASP